MTRRILAAVMALALVLVTIPVPVQAAGAAQATGQISGIARNAAGQALANHTVRLRNVKTGQLVASMTTNAKGEFSFTGLAAGDYIVEIVDAQGKIIATTAAITLAVGAMVATGVAVTATAAGAVGAAAAGGFLGGFFGTTAGIVTMSAVAAGVGVGVYQAVKSPSR